MERFSTFVCATAIALVAVFAGAAWAQAQMRRGNFADADANHDGHVTLQEFEAYAAARLMAANGPVAQRFKELSPQDQTARLQQRFEKLDRGGKGYLDRSDWDGT
jgi:Ca2+-binding EF-hand superfamily protein